MSKIKIVTDSTSDIPRELAEEYNITVIPLNVFFGDERFKDGVTISPGEFYGMCESGIYEWPSTSQPSAKEFIELYTGIFDEGYDSIISIHITSKMSGTLNSVELAKKELSDKDINVIDANTTTISLGLLAYQAAKLVKEGKTKEEILNILKTHYVPKTRTIGVIDTLEYLHKGGRIGRAKKIFGTLLKKKPLLQIKDGEVDSIGSVTGHDDAINRMKFVSKKIVENIDIDCLWIGYADKKEYADILE